MLLNKQATEKDYKYTLGGGLVGAIAGAAMTKLLEDEDKKASLKDYLVGTAVGSGLGLLGGRFLDIADDSRKNKLIKLKNEQQRVGSELVEAAFGEDKVKELTQQSSEDNTGKTSTLPKANPDVMPKSFLANFNSKWHPDRLYTYGIGSVLGPGLGVTRHILRKGLKNPKALNNWGFRLFNGLGYAALGTGAAIDLVNAVQALGDQAPIVKKLEQYDKLTQQINDLKNKQ